MVQFTAGARDVSLLQSSETISKAHPVSYSMGNRGCFSGDKAAGDFN
jgi:hypothetical protein